MVSFGPAYYIGVLQDAADTTVDRHRHDEHECLVREVDGSLNGAKPPYYPGVRIREMYEANRDAFNYALARLTAQDACMVRAILQTEYIRLGKADLVTFPPWLDRIFIDAKRTIALGDELPEPSIYTVV